MMTIELTRYTCPDCGGAIERIVDGTLLQFKCRVGHLYSPLSALNTHHDREENTIWTAAVLLEEGAEMAEELASTESGELAERLTKTAEQKRALANRVRQIAHEFPATIPSTSH